MLAATFALTPVLGAQGIASLDDAIAGLSNPMRVLVIAAHPDDEDTQLITWLARGRHVETAYLSLTRGDGGQNLLGNELGEALGAIRTEELLAARRVDGGRQYFTRAFDFGFSKSANEALQHWGKDEILKDVVTAVRSFKPHVIVSMFSGTPRDGHGHHQAAGILAREAYDIAGDATKMPVSETGGLAPWTPLKFYRGAWAAQNTDSILRINVGEYDVMSGRSYSEIAAESRSQHKSQAFGSLQQKGVRWTQVRREATRVNAATPLTAEKSIFDGIDTTWARFKTTGISANVAALVDRVQDDVRKAQATQYLRDPSSAMAPLMDLASALNALRTAGSPSPVGPAPAAYSDVRAAASVGYRRVANAIMLAGGVALEAEVTRDQIAQGDSAPLRLTAYNRGRIPLKVRPSPLKDCSDSWLKAGRNPAAPPNITSAAAEATILADSAWVWKGVACAWKDQVGAADGPYWLDLPRVGDRFSSASVTESENDLGRGPYTTVSVGTGTDTARVMVDVPVVYRYADPIRGDVSRPVAFVPEISVTTDRAIEYAPARSPIVRQLRVELRSAATTSRNVKVSLQLPAGLRADSTSREVTLPSFGAVRSATFTLRGELPPGRHKIAVVASSNGKQFTRGYTAIEYDHIRPQRLYRDASVAIEAVDLKVPPDAVIAYIQGVGDNSAAMLQQLGLRVTVLNPADIPKTDLSRYNAIVVGTRAYESNEALVANNAALLDYVKRGGTMVVQYGQYEMTQPGIMPYAITLGRPADRVTDEASPVKITDAKARVLSFPNAIDSADFKGWLQDRSLYMPKTHAPEYAGVLTTQDPAEQPNDGGILVAKYGSGTYVYTTLAFFRQLPNGVPGAARLFVNLLAAKAPATGVVP